MLQLYLDIQSVNNQIIIDTGFTMDVILYLVMLVLVVVSQTLTSNVRLIKTVNSNLEKLNRLREYTTIKLDLQNLILQSQSGKGLDQSQKRKDHTPNPNTQKLKMHIINLL